MIGFAQVEKRRWYCGGPFSFLKTGADRSGSVSFAGLLESGRVVVHNVHLCWSPMASASCIGVKRRSIVLHRYTGASHKRTRSRYSRRQSLQDPSISYVYTVLGTFECADLCHGSKQFQHLRHSWCTLQTIQDGTGTCVNNQITTKPKGILPEYPYPTSPTNPSLFI